LLLACISITVSAQEDTLKEFTKNVDVQEVSAAFSTVTIEKMPIQTLKGKDLGQLLQELTPTFIKTYGMGGIASLSIRGGGANHTQVFWNGIAINSPTLGQTDLSLMPTDFLETVTLNAGATASFDGNGGIGGSLGLKNYNSFHPQKAFSFKKEWGEFGIDNTVIKVAFGSKKFYAKTTLLRQLAKNNFAYRDYSRQGNPIVKRANANTQLHGLQYLMGFKTKTGNINIKLNYVEAKRGIPVAIGVSLQDQNQLDKSFKSALEWNYTTNNKIEIDHQVRLGFVHDFLNFASKTTSISSTFITDVLSAQYHTKWHLKNDWTLRTQIIAYEFIANSDGFEGLKYQNRLSGYIDLEKKWKKITALGSVREEVYDFDKTNTIPTVGLSYDYFREHTIFLNGGINSHQPTMNDLYWSGSGNETLQAEIAKQVELGLKETDSDKWDYVMSYFQSQVDNWIQWIPSSDGVWRPQNVKNVNKKGVNVNLKYYIRKQKNFSLIASGNYQYLDVKSVESHFTNDESVGKDLIYSPRHIANFDVTFYSKKWTLRYTQNYTSKLFLDATNTTYLPYSFPASIEGKYLLEGVGDEGDLEFKLSVHNLYGEEYQTVGNQPLPGRYFTFGFVVKFGK
jgi:iron complex outermembrane receptor protein